MIAAVVVAFNPQAERFAELLGSLRDQVDRIIVVDNGDGVAAPNCQLLRQTRNVGLAAAQNAGIRAALAAGAAHVLLLDHDSVAGRGMVAALRNALQAGLAQGVPAAAAGPVFVDEESGAESWFVRFGPFGVKRIRSKPGACPTEVDFLIASGSLLSAIAIREIGLMDESLFIDHVDTDWCLRARALGWRLYGVKSARLSHRLGTGLIQFGNRVIHSGRDADRNYYVFRNSLLLYRRKYAALAWVASDVARLVRLACSEMLFANRRWAALKAMLQGLADGVAGRTGGRPRG